MALPEWPPRVRGVLMGLGLGELFNWWQAFSVWLTDLESRVTSIDGGAP